MRPKRLFILAAGCLVIAAVLFAVRDTGPKWKGRSLSRWLDLHHESSAGELELADLDDPPEAIRQIGTNALPLLLERLRAKPRAVPPAVGTILRKLPDTLSCDRLLERWVRAPEQRAYAALDAFQILGPRSSPAIPELIKLYSHNPSGHAGQALVRIGADSVPGLVRAISDPQQTNRWLLVSVLGAMRPHAGTNGHAAVQVLINCFQNQDSVLAKNAAFALGGLRLEPELAVPVLLRRLEDPPVQTAVATALIQFGPAAREAVPALVKGLDHPRFCQDAAAILGNLALEPALSVPALARCLQSTNGPLRDEALKALGRFGGDARLLIPILLETLTNEPPTPSLDCRPAVADLLGRLRAEPALSVPALAGCLQSTNRSLRFAAIEALGRFGANARLVIPALLEALTNEPPTPGPNCQEAAARLLGRLRAEARTVVPALIVSLQSSSQSLRYSAAWALGNFGPDAEPAVPALLEAYDTADQTLHNVIVGTLRRIPPW